MKDLNITLVNYLSKDSLLKALESVEADLGYSKLDVSINVVDNSLDQDNLQQEIKKRFKKVNYLKPEKNLGFGQGTTLGFKNVEAKYYLALNPDIIIPKNSDVIKRLVEFMEAKPKIGCIGPKLINTKGEIQEACYRFDFWAIASKPLKQLNFDKKFKRVKRQIDRLLMSDFSHNETRPVDWVMGAAMLVRKEVIDQVGWFDSRYFMYMEDCDWCHTMWENNWPVYFVHDITIEHRHNRESAKIPGLIKPLFTNKLARIHLKSWLQYMWKWRKKHKYYGKVS